MKKEFLFEKLYNLLAPREQRHFERWLISELNGGRQDLLKMFQSRTSTRKPKSWEQIQVDLGLSEGHATARLDHLRGDLTERLEYFLAIHALKHDPLLRDSLTLREVQHRKSKHPFSLLFKKFHNRLLKQPTKDRLYYERLFEFYSLRQAHLVDFPPKLRKRESLVHDRIDAASKVAKLRLMRLSVNALVDSTRQNVTQLPPYLRYAKTWLFPSTRENFDGNYDSDLERILNTFFQAYTQMIWKEDQPLSLEKELFRQLKHIQAQVNHTHLSDFIAFLFNLLVRRVKFSSYARQKEAIILLFDLDAWQIEIGALPISRQSLRNTVTLFLRMAQLSASSDKKDEMLKRAESHVTDRIRFLPDEEKSSVMKFIQAHIHFFKGEFDKVLFLQTESDISDPYYHIAYQVIACQATYELEERPEDLITAVDALSQRIRKTPLLAETDKKPYLKHSTMFAKILRARTTSKLQQLQEEVKVSRPIIGREWLLKLIKERLEKER